MIPDNFSENGRCRCLQQQVHYRHLWNNDRMFPSLTVVRDPAKWTVCGSANQSQMQIPWRHLYGGYDAPNENAIVVIYDLVPLRPNIYFELNDGPTLSQHQYRGTPQQRHTTMVLSHSRSKDVVYAQSVDDCPFVT